MITNYAFFQSIIRNELWQTSYSYPFFHMSMALGTMFITTQLTRWFAPMEYQIIDFDKSWSTVGLKLACSWACGLIYLIFLLLPDRCCCSVFSSLMRPERALAGEPLRNLQNGLENGELRSDGTFMTAATLVDHEPSLPLRRSFSQPQTTRENGNQNFSHM